MAAFHTRNHFDTHSHAAHIKTKITTALPYFPELDPDTISISAFKAAPGPTTVAQTYRSMGLIEFNLDYTPSMNTVFHELGHLLEHNVDFIPNGEAVCTIYALARLPLSLTDSCELPYFGLVPKEWIQTYCKRAIEQREVKKNRSYIKWLRTTITEDKKRRPDTFPRRDSFNEYIG